MNIGQIIKTMAYGAGGAIATRVLSAVAGGFVPASFASSQFAEPVVQSAIAVFPVRMLVTKFFGKPQGDQAMIGGLISAGLKLADNYLPNVQAQLTNVLRAPLQFAQPAVVVADPTLAGYRGYRDVEEVPDSVFAGMRGGLGDVEEVPNGIWPGAF